MSSTTAKKVSARERARAKVAEQREAQRRRDEANEKDLVAILKAGEVRESAADKRDRAIERAEQVYRDAVADAEATVTERVASMRARGESVAAIAGLTEISEPDVRKHLNAHKKKATAESGSAAMSADSAETQHSGGRGGDVAERGEGREALGASGREERASEPVSVGGI